MWWLALACTSTPVVDTPPVSDTETLAEDDVTDTALVDTGEAAHADLLVNSGFEDGETSWLRYGEGSYSTATKDAVEGSSYVRLGGPPFALLYQRVAIEPGDRTLTGVSSRSMSGDAEGIVKLEFHDSDETKLVEHTWTFSAPPDWASFHLGAIAPERAATATLALSAEGDPIDFDAAWLSVAETPWVAFDLDATAQRFDGLGAQIWGYASAPDHLEQALEELDIRHVRIENVAESATLTQLTTTREVTDRLSVDWLFHCWVAPASYSSGGMLSDVDGFASWWVATVQSLAADGLTPAHIELMNEPDSGGAWSTGITSEDWAVLVPLVREGLDTAGFEDVGIVGPGGSAANYFHSNRDYLLALEDHDDLAAVSTHSWDDDAFCDGGAECLRPRLRDLTDYTEHDTLWITEWGSGETTFDGLEWPSPDVSGEVNATWSPTYGVRLLDNAIALLNGGASRLYLWQLIDEPTEVEGKDKGWGLMDLAGEPKPAYQAVAALGLPVGGDLLQPPEQDGLGYRTAAVADEDTVVVLLTNDEDEAVEAVVRLRGLTRRPEVGGQRYRVASPGDPTREEMGEAELVDLTPDVRYGGGTLELSLRLPGQTASIVRLTR